MLEVADLNLKVPDLRSGEIRLTLTPVSVTANGRLSRRLFSSRMAKNLSISPLTDGFWVESSGSPVQGPTPSLTLTNI